jgi:hypothetical protein
MGITPVEYDGSLENMLIAFHQVGMAVNELNRDMGLLDLAPGVLAPAVREKLAYLHRIVQAASPLERDSPTS